MTTITLSSNPRKQSTNKQPDFIGSFTFCGEEFDVAAWKGNSAITITFSQYYETVAAVKMSQVEGEFKGEGGLEGESIILTASAIENNGLTVTIEVEDIISFVTQK